MTKNAKIMKNDKVIHFCAGIIIAAIIGLPVYFRSHNLFSCLWPAIVGVLIAACIKEWCDMRTEGNRWDWRDFGATILGVLVVVVFIIMNYIGRG